MMRRLPAELMARLLSQVPRFARVFWGLIRDPRVPGWSKLLPVLGLAYLLFPLDAITDLLVPIGWLDDLLVLYLCLWVFVRLCPARVVAEHVARESARR